jgi:hypothetical protein
MGERSGDITRRDLLRGAGKAAAVGVAATAVGVLEVGNPAAALAAGRGEVGTAVGSRNAYEYLGEVDQDGDSLRYFGYLTAIARLGVAKLFTGTPHDEGSARFTYFGTAKLISRAVRAGVFTIDAVGTIQYRFSNHGGADFSDPATFRQGTLIASDKVTFHDVLSVTAPNTGLPNVTAALTRTRAPQFTLDGTPMRFGHVGMLAKSSATGLGTKLDPKPKAHLTLAGEAWVTGSA